MYQKLFPGLSKSGSVKEREEKDIYIHQMLQHLDWYSDFYQ